MSDSDSFSRRPDYGDNRLIDLLAAVATSLALCLCFFVISPNPIHLLPDIEMASTLFGSFIVAAALVLPWRHKVRARWGWVAVAVLGVAFMYAANVAWDKMTGVDICACGEDFTLAQQGVVLAVWLPPSLLFMGMFHYLGLLIRRSRRRVA